MIQVTRTYKCRVCGSQNIVKNGKNKAGQAQYHCKDCGAYRVLEPKPQDQRQRRSQVLKAYQERCSVEKTHPSSTSGCFSVIVTDDSTQHIASVNWPFSARLKWNWGLVGNALMRSSGIVISGIFANIFP